MSERPISEVLREFNDASYPGTNWPELMARAPELLAIVEAAKNMEWFLRLLMTTTKILRGPYARQANEIREDARKALEAAGEESSHE